MAFGFGRRKSREAEFGVFDLPNIDFFEGELKTRELDFAGEHTCGCPTTAALRVRGNVGQSLKETGIVMESSYANCNRCGQSLDGTVLWLHSKYGENPVM